VFVIADAPNNVVLAQRHGTRDILTTDQRDSRKIELPAKGYFCILTYDDD
jgi:hypothetical protein